jgi:hypothetical protein
MVLGADPARAATSVSGGLNIPDNHSGLLSSTFVSGQTGTLADVDVTLELAGGFDGDYYAYVWHAGHLATLQEGRQEGFDQARRLDVLDALEARFGACPDPVAERVRSLSGEPASRRALRLAVTARTLQDFLGSL